MNNLKRTITTLEVANMMEISHKDILKKLEGAKDRKGYIQILTEGQMSPSDYFIQSTYKDASGKENKCYEVTKLGCDFLANKFTGEKGVLFTARYVKKFDEMENVINLIPLTEHPGEVANLICTQYGIKLITDFVKLPEYEQLSLNMANSNQIGMLL